MSCRKHVIAVLIAAASILAPRVAAAQAAAAGDEQKLLGVLGKTETPYFEKAKACQRLAVIGTKAAVPVLAGLLADEKLAHYARFGLEPIPDPSVDAALREAAGKLQGKLLVGVLHSIGARRDAKAVSDVAKRLTDADAAVAGAAATALGRIGNAETGKILTEALAKSPPELRPAVGQAALVCAEALLAGKSSAEAAVIYDAVRRADLPRYVQLAGARGAVVARGAEGASLLAELLRAAEEDAFNLALGLSRELKGPEVTRTLIASISGLQPPRQALVLGALGDRGDRAAVPATLDAARGGAPVVKSAAARALGKLGDASAVPVLVAAATAADPDVAEAARATLAAFPGKEAEAAIVAALEKSDAGSRSAIFDVVGRRRLRSAIPVLRKAAEDGDETTRIAALQALGNTVGLDDIPYLVERVLKPRSAGEKPVALEALRTACLRMPEPDACAAKVAQALAGAPAPVRIELLGVFTSIGGGKALQIVAASARDADESIREAAVRTIAAWESDDSGDALVGLIKGTTDARDRARLYGGLNALLRTLKFPKEKKIALCNEAFAAARDDAERKLALDCYGGVPAVETLPLIFPHLENPALKEKTASVVTSICERLARLQKGAVIEPLKKVLAATGDKDLAARARKLLEEAGGKL